MNEKGKSKFDKVLSSWDILVLAFGAMIGWGWIVSTGRRACIQLQGIWSDWFIYLYMGHYFRICFSRML